VTTRPLDYVRDRRTVIQVGLFQALPVVLLRENFWSAVASALVAPLTKYMFYISRIINIHTIEFCLVIVS
jgi:hypothetical protein